MCKTTNMDPGGYQSSNALPLRKDQNTHIAHISLKVVP